MDRCALFVDAGYVLSDGTDAVHGTRRPDSVRWDHAGLLKLLADLARERTGLPVLRCYWYEANADAVPGAEHEALAELPGLKLRLRRAGPGRREGIEADLKRDLLTLARNHAISDALIVTGDENIAELVTETQDHGIRVVVAHITANGRWTLPSALRHECDDLVEIPADQLRPFAELITVAQTDAAGVDRYMPAQPGRAIAGDAAVSQGVPAGVSAFPAPAAAIRPAAHSYDPDSQPTGQFASAPPSTGYFGAGVSAAGHLAPDMRAAHVDPSAPATVQFDASAAAAGPPENGAQAAIPRFDFSPAGSANAVDQDLLQNGSGQQADMGQRNGWHQDAGLAGGPHGNDGARHPASYSQLPDEPMRNGQPADQFGGRYADRAGQDIQYASGNGQSQLPLSHGGGMPLSSGIPQGGGMPPGGGLTPGGGLPVSQAGSLPASRASSVPALPGSAPMPPAPPTVSRPQGPDPVRPGYPGDQWYGADVGATVLSDQARRDAQLRHPAPTAPPGQSEQSVRLGYGSQADRGGLAQPGRAADQVTRANHVVRSDQGAQAAQAGRSGQAAGDGFGASRSDQVGPAAPTAPFYYPRQPERAGSQMPPVAAPGAAFDPLATPLHAATEARLASAGTFAAPRSGAPPSVSGLPSPLAQAAPPSAGQPLPPAFAVSEAVRVAHGEGHSFGETVARDAPALWLDAVLARKPRMPSDLEARLLQGSALPIDSLLNDDVRQALRHGFWDALESSRR